MKIASNTEANNTLTFVLVIIFLLIIDALLIPWIISSPYSHNFRAYSAENLAEFINFANDYEKPKVHFVGSSVFFGHGLEKWETIPVKFEKCSGIKTFNLAVAGGKLNDQINIINHLDNNVTIIFEVNPLAFDGEERLNKFTFANNESISNKIWVPNLYSKRYLLQEFFFEKSTKEYVKQMYEKLVDPNYGATRNPGKRVDFSAKEIKINQEQIQILESAAGKKINFVLLPIFNSTYVIDSVKLESKAIDLTNLNISKEYFLDSAHFREMGADIIAEELCRRVKL